MGGGTGDEDDEGVDTNVARRSLHLCSHVDKLLILQLSSRPLLAADLSISLYFYLALCCMQDLAAVWFRS